MWGFVKLGYVTQNISQQPIKSYNVSSFLVIPHAVRRRHNEPVRNQGAAAVSEELPVKNGDALSLNKEGMVVWHLGWVDID